MNNQMSKAVSHGIEGNPQNGGMYSNSPSKVTRSDDTFRSETFAQMMIA